LTIVVVAVQWVEIQTSNERFIRSSIGFWIGSRSDPD
jgi:hypothetical protein